LRQLNPHDRNQQIRLGWTQLQLELFPPLHTGNNQHQRKENLTWSKPKTKKLSIFIKKKKLTFFPFSFAILSKTEYRMPALH
jgi:hypothetical protein